jgi:hypothetical protein
VALLVCGDGAADPSEAGIAELLGLACRVAAGDEGGALLERRVDEAAVGALVGGEAHPDGDEVVDGLLHAAHVHATAQVQVPPSIRGTTAPTRDMSEREGLS